MAQANQTKKSSASRKGKTILKILGVTVLTGGLGFAGWYFWPGRKKEDSARYNETFAPDTPRSVPTSQPSAPAIPSAGGYRSDQTYPVSSGAKGLRVMLIQEALNDAFEASLKVDGAWGTSTSRALSKAGLPSSFQGKGIVKLVSKMKLPAPLQRGSKGNKVKIIQSALIAQFGRQLLPRYGADSDWGMETENALRAKGLPTQIGVREFASLAGEIINGKFNGLAGIPEAGKQAVTIYPTQAQDEFEQVMDLPEGMLLGAVLEATDLTTTISTPTGRILQVPTPAIAFA